MTPTTEPGGLVAICSARPRPSVQNNHSKGGQWWARDVYHLQNIEAATGKTICGRDCTEWLIIGQLDTFDDNCCKRCLAKSRSSQ